MVPGSNPAGCKTCPVTKLKIGTASAGDTRYLARCIPPTVSSVLRYRVALVYRKRDKHLRQSLKGVDLALYLERGQKGITSLQQWPMKIHLHNSQQQANFAKVTVCVGHCPDWLNNSWFIMTTYEFTSKMYPSLAARRKDSDLFNSNGLMLFT